MMRKMSDRTLARLKKAKAALQKRLRRHPHVVALGVGYRERGGRIVQRGCVRVHVFEKLPLDKVPRNLRLPQSIDGVPIDVVESRFTAHAVDPMSRCDPLCGGVMVTGARPFAATGKVGSAGLVVSTAGSRLLLSCWHVLYGPTGSDDDTVVQPRPSANLNNIGRTRVGIITDRVDCAVAEVDDTRTITNTILEIPTAVLTRTTPRPGLLVRKSGVNGLGLGLIVAIDSDPPVFVGGATRTFIDQIEIVPRPGADSQFKTSEMDSGALWISDDDGGVVGLHFAGSPGRALANPITAVIDALAEKGIDLGL